MPLRFTLRQLEYFVAVGEAGSIAKAAALVNVSPPSISASIAQLEAEFGIELFVRKHSHGLALTSGGKTFLRVAQQLLADADALHSVAGSFAGEVRGPLSIGCLATFAQIILPELRKQFEAKHPEVRIRQYERNQTQIFDMLLGGDLDVALTYDLELSQDMSFEPLASLPPFVMLPAEHRLAGHKTISPEALAEEPMVLLDLPVSKEYFLSTFHHKGIRPNVAERTSDIAVMRSMVANGFGYGIANMRPLNSMSPDGKPLVFVPLGGGARPLILGVVTPNATHRTETVKQFIAHCKEYISAQEVFGLDQ